MHSIDQKVSSLVAPKRLDAYLTQTLAGKFSREAVKVALEQGTISVNGLPSKPRTLLHNGDHIQGSLSLEEKPSSLMAETAPVPVLYEDASLLIVDKPVGMVVHPGAGRSGGTLVNLLLGRGGKLSSAGEKQRPGIVHRLDKDTSGVLIVAKDNTAHRKLQAQFAERSLSKTYWALVKGRVEFEEGRISEPIGRDPKIMHKMAVSHKESARDAETIYKVLKRFRYSTLLEVRILTGRTHQIRVHMAHLGHPVLGDVLYGNTPADCRLALHAWKIEFLHPKTGKMVSFESPIPQALTDLLLREEHAKSYEKR